MGYRPLYKCECPFYDREYRKGVCCEGIDAAASTIQMFADEKDKVAFIKKNCKNEIPEDCKIFNLLIEKYADSD